MAFMASKNADKVLFINVDGDILDIFIKGLQGEASISFTSEGSKALEMVRLNKPDLILLDVMTSDMSGFEACRVLKTDPVSQHIPVVFLTKNSDRENISKGLKLGATDYITEPLVPDVIIAKVRNFLEQITASRASERPKESSSSEAEQTLDQRPQGEARPDSFPKPAKKAQRVPLAKFLIIALFIVATAGGGYALFLNAPVNVLNRFETLYSWVIGLDYRTELAKLLPLPLEPVIEEDMAEEDLAEEDEQTPVQPQSNETVGLPVATRVTPPTPAPSTDSCGDIPKIPWWGNASHESIITYVNNKNNGDWDVYIAKWERQLLKLRDIHSRGGTGITPILGSRLHGPALAEYISQFEKRLDVARCLARALQ
jgi:CheY-like chemotaxis protein